MAEQDIDQEDASDDDDDYNPDENEMDEEDENDEVEAIADVEPLLRLAPSQKKAVDDAFQDMFGYPWGTTFKLGPKLGRKERLLIEMFGPSGAAQILQVGVSQNRRRQFRPRRSTSEKGGPVGPDLATVSGILQQQSKEGPSETKVFAGKVIKVATKTPSKTNPTAASGLDKALQQISGPAKISTVAKTSHDWDAYKVDTGLEAELEQKAQGKDSFLVKKDFLNRVDARKFELEREERDRERAKRGK